jgi:predicted transcriptional regulator
VEQLQLASKSEPSKRKIARLVGMSRGTADRAWKPGEC